MNFPIRIKPFPNAGDVEDFIELLFETAGSISSKISPLEQIIDDYINVIVRINFREHLMDKNPVLLLKQKFGVLLRVDIFVRLPVNQLSESGAVFGLLYELDVFTV